MTQHNCYNCKHRRDVSGSAHSSCNSAGDSSSVVSLYLAAHVSESNGDFQNLKLNPHGMKNGWALWPVDFDPCWVERCNFYESIETK